MKQHHHTSNYSFLNACKHLPTFKNAFVVESVLVNRMFAKEEIKAPGCHTQMSGTSIKLHIKTN